MGFESLLGNEQLLENLQCSINRGRVSHFYLLCGPTGAGKKTLAKLLAAAALCRGQEKPCMTCNSCRKVFAGSHPDFITVDDPEKKTVSVDLIRNARADIYVHPNESDRKVYLFPRAQDMGIPGQNALLKVLEEPPSYGVFLLLTDNPERLLPTVRSRCTELKLGALPEDVLRKRLQAQFPEAQPEALSAAIIRSGGFLGQAIGFLEEGSGLSPQTQAFLQAFTARDAIGLVRVLVPMEKWKRDQVIPELTQWLQLLQMGLMARSGMDVLSGPAATLRSARSSQELLHAVRDLQTGIEYIQGNVSVAAVCGYLAWALR